MGVINGITIGKCIINVLTLQVDVNDVLTFVSKLTG